MKKVKNYIMNVSLIILSIILVVLIIKIILENKKCFNRENFVTTYKPQPSPIPLSPPPEISNSLECNDITNLNISIKNKYNNLSDDNKEKIDKIILSFNKDFNKINKDINTCNTILNSKQQFTTYKPITTPTPTPTPTTTSTPTPTSTSN